MEASIDLSKWEGHRNRAIIEVLFSCGLRVSELVNLQLSNLYLDEESYWYGSDQRGSFVSGSYLFDNTNLPEWSYWSEFAYANRTATDFASLYPDQFNNTVGGGHGGSDNYVVAYPYSGRIQVMNKEADVLRGFYVTNDAWTVDAILHGDGMTPGVFHTGDYLKIIITGTHPDGTTSSKEYYLADYRDADERYGACERRDARGEHA